MDVLGKGVTATLGLFDIHFWYVIFGILIAAWTFFLLASAIIRRFELPVYIFGALIFLAIEWFGFSSIYNTSNGKINLLQTSSIIIPAALLISQIIIFIIIAKYRSKQSSVQLVCEKLTDKPNKKKTKKEPDKTPDTETVDEKPADTLESQDG